MKIYSTYSVKIKHYNHIFDETVRLYRNAVDFFIDVCLKEWSSISAIQNIQYQKRYVETVSVRTKKNPDVRYDFSSAFYKFPSYLRRTAIAEALGKVSSYKSNLKNWYTSKFAYDGSGTVCRGYKVDLPSYSLCKFQNGKVYNCDLSASYNIGARYFIREILKSLPEKTRLQAVAEVPRLSKRSTCTWFDFIKLNAVLNAVIA